MAAKFPNPRDAISFEQVNPKKRGTKAGDRYEVYKSARTVEEAKRLGASNGDLTHDFKKGFLKADSSSAPAPAANGIAGFFPVAQPSRVRLRLTLDGPTDQAKTSETGCTSSSSRDGKHQSSEASSALHCASSSSDIGSSAQSTKAACSASSSNVAALVSKPRSDPEPGCAHATATASSTSTNKSLSCALSRDDYDPIDEFESGDDQSLAQVLRSSQQKSLPDPQQLDGNLSSSKPPGASHAISPRAARQCSREILNGTSHSADKYTNGEPLQKKRKSLSGHEEYLGRHHAVRALPASFPVSPLPASSSSSSSLSSSSLSSSSLSSSSSSLSSSSISCSHSLSSNSPVWKTITLNKEQRMIDLSEGDDSGDAIKVVCRLGVVKKELIEEPSVANGATAAANAEVHEGLVANGATAAASNTESSAMELSEEQRAIADQAKEREEFEAAQVASYEAAHEEKKRKDENERELLQQGSLEPLEVLDGKFMQSLYEREKIMNALVCDAGLRLALFRYLRIRRQAATWYGTAVEDYFARTGQSLMDTLDGAQQDSSVESFNNEHIVLEAAQLVESAVFAMPTAGRSQWKVPELFAPTRQAEVDAEGKMIALDDGSDSG